jgi:hypothetical protein
MHVYLMLAAGQAQGRTTSFRLYYNLQAGSRQSVIIENTLPLLHYSHALQLPKHEVPV